MTTTAITTTSASSLTPVLSTEQKDLQGQIGNSGTWSAWFSKTFASAKSVFGKVMEWLKARRETISTFFRNNPQYIGWVRKGGEFILNRPETQATLQKMANRLPTEIGKKLMEPEVQKELLNAAIDVGLKLEGSETKFEELKAKYGPLVMEEMDKLAKLAFSSIVEMVGKQVGKIVSSVTSAARDSFSSAPVAAPAVR